MSHQLQNDLLFTEYEKYHNVLLNLFDEDTKKTLSQPIFMHVFPEYEKVGKKILVVGQETKGWCGSLSDSDKTAKKVIDEYKGFELAKNYYNSPFWRFNKTLFSKINPENKPNGLLWTNLSKVDQNNRGVNKTVRSKNKAGYKLLLKEIEVTNPEIIVFMTCWKEDENLKSIFGNITFEKVEDIDPKYLVRLKNDNLPHNTFRTYHPNFLNRGNRSKFSINQIIDKIAINSN